MKVDKNQIRAALVKRLQSEVEALMGAAKAAHEAATHEESRAEDHHDTRGLEASYLAGAQAQRAADLQALISVYRLMPLPELGAGDPIAPGALVELELEDGGRRSRYFIVPRGGGTTVTIGGAAIQVVAPQSPLGEALIGRRAGDTVDVETKDRVREYQVVSVQ
jgi:transcription elongation GreA/GreB family factor